MATPLVENPKNQFCEKNICCRRIPNPSVANARNTPVSRIAGMAMIAPTGIATAPARRIAKSQGMCRPVVK